MFLEKIITIDYRKLFQGFWIDKLFYRVFLKERCTSQGNHEVAQLSVLDTVPTIFNPY